MKNKEIIQIGAMAVLAAALLFRKYWKKNRSEKGRVKRMAGNSLFSSSPQDEEYLPYSKNNDKE